VTPLATDMSHCGLLAALTIILYGAPATFLCDSVTLISACSSSAAECCYIAARVRKCVGIRKAVSRSSPELIIIIIYYYYYCYCCDYYSTVSVNLRKYAVHKGVISPPPICKFARYFVVSLLCPWFNDSVTNSATGMQTVILQFPIGDLR